jgi:hypothetical protein
MPRPDGKKAIEQWGAIVEFYSRFVGRMLWEYLTPMIELSRWVMTRPYRGKLYPFIRHEWLYVLLVPGYSRLPLELPFFSVGVGRNGLFEFQLWGGVGDLRRSRRCTETAVTSVFDEFVARLECLMGNPLNPRPTIDPAWLRWNDETVPRIARSIYEDRRFGDMPVLHDALLDAGCDDQDILDHCQAPGPHAQGCWVLDLLLGKV